MMKLDKNLINLQDLKLKSFIISDEIQKKMDKYFSKFYKNDDKTFEMITGETSESKIKRVRKVLEDTNTSLIVISELDTIAYLLNLRGRDLKNEHLFLSYFVIYSEYLILFTDSIKPDDEGNNNTNININGLKDLFILPYSNFDIFINNPHDFVKGNLNFDYNEEKSKKVLISNDCNQYIYEKLEKNFPSVKYTDKLRLMQSIKNRTEITGMFLSQIYDAIAITNLLGYLKKSSKENVILTEVDIENKLYDLRSNLKGFRGKSFESIIASGANAAVVHHRASSEKIVDFNKVLLMDIGSHFYFGTTDTTRTVLFKSENTVDNYKKRLSHDYTLVLKCHLAPMIYSFKIDDKLNKIDELGRQCLIEEGKRYGHALSHGVGHYLCVHESPPRISPNLLKDDIYENFIISIEPGYYLEGDYGIRIESLICSLKLMNKNSEDDKIKLVNLTPIPYHLSLIEKNILSINEIEYLNDFNIFVKDLLIDLVDDLGREYLIENTKLIK